MSLAKTLYNAVFRRTSTLVFTGVVSAFAFERLFDLISETAFDRFNEGKQWKDVKKRLEL